MLMPRKYSSLLARFASIEFVRDILVISGGTGIAQLLPILLTPVLTRMYSPEDMGLLGLYVAFVGFCANATTLGFSMAIVSGRTDREGARLVLLSGLMVVPMATVFTILLACMVVMNVLGFGELNRYSIVAMWVSLIFTGAFLTLRYWLVRSRGYLAISHALIAQSTGRMGTQVLLGFTPLGWAGLIAGEVVGRGSGLMRVWRTARDDLGALLSGVTRRDILTTASEFKKFPLLTTPSSLLNSLGLVLPVPLITMHFGLYEAGQFAVAYRVLGLPLSLVGASVADVFHSRIGRLSREVPKRAIRFLILVSASLLAIGILPMIVVTFFGDRLFQFVLGDEWSTAGLLAAAIAPWVLMEFVVGPVSRVVLVYRGQELKLIYDVLALISIVGGILYGSSQGWTLVETCRLLGWTQAAVYSVYFFLLLRIIRKYEMINYVDS